MTDDTSGLEEPTPRTHTTGSTHTAVWIVIALLGAALVFTATLAVIEWRRAEDLRHAASVRKTAASTAAQFAAALYTYDYNDVAGAKTKVLRFATPKYAKQFDAASPPQQETIAKLKARETGRVTGVFLTDVVKDHAAGVVIVDTTAQSTAGSRRATNYLDVALVRQGSTWKVDAARAVPLAP